MTMTRALSVSIGPVGDGSNRVHVSNGEDAYPEAAIELDRTFVSTQVTA